MATIKSFSDLQQSKKLAEILPLESADMWYVNGEGEPLSGYWNEASHDYDDIPCWSLASLLDVLPEYNLQRIDWGNKTEYKIVVTTDEDNYASKNYDNPVDACVDMIEKLHELKML